MSFSVPPSSVGDPEIVPQVIQQAPTTQFPVSPYDSDPALAESESNNLYYHILTNCVYRSWSFLTQGTVEVPLNTTTNDTFLLESATELPQGASAEDVPFELHIWGRFIINSMKSFLKRARDQYIREHTFFLLRSTLFLTVEVPTADTYLQDNEDKGAPIFIWLLDMPANIRRTSEGSRRKAYLDTIFKRIVDGLSPDYESEPSALHKYPYSWFRYF